MPSIQTNRDLYRAVLQLSRQHEESGRSLEQYLSALLVASEPYAARSDLSLSEFFLLLEQAFTVSPPIFDETWLDQYDSFDARPNGYAGWQACVRQQIVDLHEMDTAGTLNNEWRYFGMDAPRGGRWYNFTPHAYLECGMAGAFDAWDEEEGERILVSGKVAVLDEKGEIHSVNAQDIDHPVAELHRISWELFKDFVVCGQIYE